MQKFEFIVEMTRHAVVEANTEEEARAALEAQLPPFGRILDCQIIDVDEANIIVKE